MLRILLSFTSSSVEELSILTAADALSVTVKVYSVLANWYRVGATVSFSVYVPTGRPLMLMTPAVPSASWYVVVSPTQREASICALLSARQNTSPDASVIFHCEPASLPEWLGSFALLPSTLYHVTTVGVSGT